MVNVDWQWIATYDEVLHNMHTIQVTKLVALFRPRPRPDLFQAKAT